MKIKFFIELKAISDTNFKESFSENEVNILEKKEILKIEYKEEKKYYKFNYVGLIILNSIMIIVLPKYIQQNFDKNLEGKKIINILNRYFDKSKNKYNLNDLGINTFKNNFDQFSYYNYLIKDYVDSGLYVNHKKSSTLNGVGEIDWDKTINELDSYKMNKHKSIFLDYYTIDISLDDENYIKNLHMYCLNKSSKFLNPLNNIGFYFPSLDFQINNDILGTKEYQLFKLNKELESVFSDRKIKLLSTLKGLIENEEKEIEKDVLIYGTKTFYNVWEKACGYILKNEYKKFKEYIDKPNWNLNSISFLAEKTFKPDILVDFNDTFYIFDAKYYLPNIGKKKSFPGVEDISKQYLYELIFSNVEEIKNKNRKNIFLMPTTSKQFEYLGKVELKFLKDIGLQDIIIIKIPVEIVFNLYCNNKYLDLSYIEKLIFDNRVK